MPAASHRLLQPATDILATSAPPLKRPVAKVTRAPKTSGPKEPSPERRRATDRRGPMRPEALAAVRTLLDGRIPERVFRVVDGMIIGVLAAALCQPLIAQGLLSASIAEVMPLLAGAAILIWSLNAVGAYRFEAHERLSGHLVRTSSAFAPVALILASWFALVSRPTSELAQAAIWLSVAFAVVYLAHVGWWMTVNRWRKQGRLTPNIVVVGATRQAEHLIRNLLETREANVLGVFDDRLDRAPDDILGVPVLGDTDSLLLHRITPYLDRIVLTVPPSAQGRVRQIMERLRVLPNEISLFLDFEAKGSDAVADRLASTPLARLSGVRRDERKALWKRVQDLTIGAVALVFATPVMAGIALAIRLEGPGPIIFRQRRHGFNNEEITVWKFRSMRQGGAPVAAAARQVSARDERITKVGRIIRRTSLDELPQIFNVLAGQMSLVGPRPHAIGMKTGEVESARLVAEYAHRHRLKPGMTGWAAVHGSRGPVDTPEAVRERVALDVEYIERQSFWLDLYIIIVTIPCLLGDRHTVR